MLALPVGAGAEARPAQLEVLPVRKVVLYKNGVGYFERSGELRAGDTARLDFKASDMNDVLKSLTIVDRSGGVIGGLDLQHPPRNKSAPGRQEFVHVVAVDRRPPIESIHLRQRRHAPQVAPRGAFEAARDGSRPRRPPRAEQRLDCSTANHVA